MKIIDAHVHIGLNKFCRIEKTEFNANLNNDYKDFIKVMDKNNIAKSLILPIPHKDFDSYLSNEYIYIAYSAFPDRFIPFCRIDDKLEENVKKGFRGAKIHFVYEQTDIEQVKNALLYLESVEAPIIIHASFSNKVKQIKKILKIAPNLRIILAHMGRGQIFTGGDVIENATELKKHDNVFFETSTVGNALAVKEACDIVGDDRVMFGSDYPFGKAWFKNVKTYQYSDELVFLNDAGLSTDCLEKILYVNAYNLLDLSRETRAVTVRKIKNSDFEQVVELLLDLTETDKKFLALEHKISLIKQQIKKERHCYVAVSDNKIVGFMRESGRPEGYSLLEELVVHPKYRNQCFWQVQILAVRNLIFRAPQFHYWDFMVECVSL